MKTPSPPPLTLPCAKLLWLTRRTRADGSVVIALEAKGTKTMPRTSKPSIFLFMQSISFLTINTHAYYICAHKCYLGEGSKTESVNEHFTRDMTAYDR